MPSNLTIHNELNECIVVITYFDFDSVQILPTTRTEVAKQAVTNIIVEQSVGTPLRIHICRIGLFGLTSPRTRMTSGQGFSVYAGETYCVRAIPADANGNLCSVHMFNPVDGTFRAVYSPPAYKFGDKLIKPAIRLAGFGGLFMGESVFEDHMAARVAQNMSDNQAVPSGVAPAVSIDESEIWGVFFEQTLHAGVRAHKTQHFISSGDLEMQEPYLFIGIPAVALMETVTRSLHDPEGLIFVDGRRVTLETCVDSFKLLFGLLMETKKRLSSIRTLSDNENIWVQQFLLYAGADKAIQSDSIDEERKDELRNAFSSLVSVSTQLTQRDCYKANFVKVLERILTWEPAVNTAEH